MSVAAALPVLLNYSCTPTKGKAEFLAKVAARSLHQHDRYEDDCTFIKGFVAADCITAV